MLYQGGLLTRDGDVRKFTYTKSAIAKGSEGEIANVLMDRRNDMFGYNQANPSLKQRVKKAEVEHRLPPITESVEADVDVEEVVAPVRLVQKPTLNVFTEMSNDFEAVKKVLPNLTVKDFLIMWLRGSGKA